MCDFVRPFVRHQPDKINLRRRQRREAIARKTFLRNPRVLLSTSLLWLPCMFLFLLKFRLLQRGR